MECDNRFLISFLFFAFHPGTEYRALDKDSIIGWNYSRGEHGICLRIFTGSALRHFSLRSTRSNFSIIPEKTKVVVDFEIAPDWHRVA